MWNGELTEEMSKSGTEIHHYDGIYKFPDGATFIGRVSVANVHRTAQPIAPGYSEIVEHPCEPRAEFTGTWVGPTGGGYPPVAPPVPDELKSHLESLQVEPVVASLPDWLQVIKNRFLKR